MASVVVVVALAGGLGASSASAAGELVAEPEVVDFGQQAHGVVATRAVTLRNLGPDPVAFSDIWIEGEDVEPFDFAGGSCDAVSALDVDATCDVLLAFVGPETFSKPYEVTFVAAGDVDDIPALATVRGRSGDPGLLAMGATAIDFGGVRIGQTSAPRTVRITNVGGQVIDLNSATGPLFGRLRVSGPFVVSADGCAQAVLAPGAGCDVTVVYRPSSSLTTSEHAAQTGTLSLAYMRPVSSLGFVRREMTAVTVGLAGHALSPSGRPLPTRAELERTLKAGLARSAARANRLVAARKRVRVRFAAFVPGPAGIAKLTIEARVGKRRVVVARPVETVAAEERLRFVFKVRPAARKLLASGRSVRVRTVAEFKLPRGGLRKRAVKTLTVRPARRDGGARRDTR